MKEAMKKEKNLILEKVRETTDSIFEASKTAVPVRYTAGIGDIRTEEPGTYSKLVSGEMSRDIMNVALFLYSKDSVMVDRLKNVRHMFDEKDIALRRMADDLKDERPLTEYPYKTSEQMIQVLAELKNSDAMDDKYLSLFKTKIDEWVERIGKMDIWAYCFETKQRLRRLESDAYMLAYNDKGEQVYGMPEENADCVKILIPMTLILLQALVRIPFSNENSALCMEKIEILVSLIDRIASEEQI